MASIRWNGWMDGGMMDGWMDRWVDGWIHSWIDGIIRYQKHEDNSAANAVFIASVQGVGQELTQIGLLGT